MNTDLHTYNNHPPPDREKIRASFIRLIDAYSHYLNMYSQLEPMDCSPLPADGSCAK